MSKRFTYLFAGFVALSAALPATVAAQSVRLKVPSQTVQKLRTGVDLRYAKVPNKVSLTTANRLKAPRHAAGTTYDTPYLEEFNSEASVNDFTIIDANNDTHTWDYFEGSNESVVRYHWDSTNSADDWIITPGIRLKAGKSYNVGFKARANSSSFHERLEAKWGQGTTVADLTNQLLPSTDLTTSDYVVFNQEVTPAADGVYNFGFHAISDPDRFYLYLDSISVTELADAGAPDSVTNLAATADPTGALKVTLTFNAPSKKIDGTALSAIDSLVVRKGSATIQTINNPAPGAALSVVDENASAGENRYTIFAANDKGDGRAANISATAGPDVPNPPQVTAHDNQTNIRFTWPNVTGANGGVIIPSEVSYEIWNTEFNVNDQLVLADSITTVKGVNEYTLNQSTTEGDQDIKYWAFNAKNASGASQYTVAPVIVGAPYTLPFANSFANGTLENQFFGLSADSDYPTWGITTGDAADGDGGAAIFYNEISYYGYSLGAVPGEASLYTGKISLQGAQNPELVFSYNGSTSTDARLVAEVEHANGTIDSLWTESFTGGAGTWKTATVNLPASVASDPFVYIHFRGIANNADPQQILVDNIHVTDPYQNDAAISVTAPASLVKGQSANIVATVSNQGIDPLSGLEVKISVNDEVIKDTTLAQSLALFNQVEIPVTYKTSSTQSASSLNVKAEVVNATDLDDTNNTATASVALTQADVNAPTNLQGTETTDSVNLTWTAPETSNETITDDFESYTAWATSDVGEWTFVNADGAQFGTLTQSGSVPNDQAYAAYEVWRPNDVFAEDPTIAPHSGEQCLVSVYKADFDNDQLVNSDDWVISPELSGAAQTVTFWANNYNVEDEDTGESYGAETFQVLTSTTDKNTTSFTQIGNNYTQESAVWTKYTINLPAGTKYFAIRRTTSSDESMLFFLDDISFEAGTSAESYNIYVDGKLAGNTATTSYNGKNDGGHHTYSVTAVYADGSESAPVSIDFTANSIDDIHAQLKADKYDVYTLSGAQVKLGAKNLNGLTPGVYVINGKKVLLK